MQENNVCEIFKINNIKYYINCFKKKNKKTKITSVRLRKGVGGGETYTLPLSEHKCNSSILENKCMNTEFTK